MYVGIHEAALVYFMVSALLLADRFGPFRYTRKYTKAVIGIEKYEST